MDGWTKDDVGVTANAAAARLRRPDASGFDKFRFAGEVGRVSRREQRQLGSRMTVLLAHLLKWKYQPKRRCHSWEATIREQRTAIHIALQRSPSLKHALADDAWLGLCWKDGVALARAQTNLMFPGTWIWSVSETLDEDFWPN
ncbi:DUF29 domain-containing protein [Massilia solisilvae]